MTPPAFWYASEGREAARMTRALLAPLSWLYGMAGAWRIRRARPVHAPVPVICIGNVTLGGAGKTPVARAMLAHLRARGVAAHALSRGHGGRLRGPVRADPASHSYRDVGDEPLLLARDGAAWIARDRPAGALAAAKAGAGAVVMDDGFQNPSLHKALSLLVIDAVRPYGNGKVFPAGPLREPLSAALARADAVVLMRGVSGEGADDPAAPDLSELGLDGFSGPVLTAHLAPLAPPPPGPLIAFAGIGWPQKFFDALRDAGGEISEAASFPDHHPYAESDLAWLARAAEERGATLITTEKDYVRLPPLMRARARTFAVEARFDDPDAFAALLARVEQG